MCVVLVINWVFMGVVLCEFAAVVFRIQLWWLL